MFEKIYEAAKEASLTNSIEQQKIENEEKEIKENYSKEELIRKEVEGSQWLILNRKPNKEEVYSEELLKIVEDNDFFVMEYGKRTDEVKYDEYDPTIEYYSVAYKNYLFIIKHFDDVDIPEGIFAVYEINNMVTNETIKYYLDLGCRNTCRIKFDNFLEIMSYNSEAEYIANKYQKYYRISELLKERGIKVLEEKIKSEASRIEGYIKLADNLFICIYNAWLDETRIVITNKPNWNVNDYNSNKTVGYYVDYKNDKDIDLLIDNIAEFARHMTGIYGYKQGDIYYKNIDIERIISPENFKKDGKYIDAYNNYHIKIEQVKNFDGRGYGDRPYINCYKGLEMAKHFMIFLNDAAQWSKGNIINMSDIVIKYDTNIDKDNCILLINNYQYKNDQNYQVYIEDNYTEDGDYYREESIDKLYNDINKDLLIDSIEFRGTFTEVIETFRNYINTLCEIFNVEAKI